MKNQVWTISEIIGLILVAAPMICITAAILIAMLTV
jgi:hypothetical protein